MTRLLEYQRRKAQRLNCGVMHVQVESENRAAAAKQKASTGRGWFGWARGGGGAPKSEGPSELSEEDQQKIMALVTEQEDALQPGADRDAWHAVLWMTNGSGCRSSGSADVTAVGLCKVFVCAMLCPQRHAQAPALGTHLCHINAFLLTNGVLARCRDALQLAVASVGRCGLRRRGA